MSGTSFVILSGTSHPKLAEEIAGNLGVPLGKTKIELFPDNEIGVEILENVRGRDVFAVQSIAKKPNFYFMELLILIDAVKRASARSIVAVISYYGYARQDRKEKGRVPITGKLVADLLQKAGVTRVVTMDLHSEQIQGFFDIPVDNLYAQNLFVEKIKTLAMKNFVICSPDLGSTKRAHLMADELGTDLAIVEKQRINANEVETHALIGNVQGRDVVLVDDICSTGTTLKKASEVVKKRGAARVIAAVTHPLFNAKMVKESEIDTFFVTNTIPLSEEIDLSRVEIFSVAGIFGKAIDCIIKNESISSLFRSGTTLKKTSEVVKKDELPELLQVPALL